MGVIKSFLDKIFGKNSKSRVDVLNEECNVRFNNIFNKCRYLFGNELIEVINIKNSVVDTFKNSNQYIAGQELIVEKMLELIETYMSLCENGFYLAETLKKSKTEYSENAQFQIIKSKMDNCLDIIHSLNTNLCMNFNDKLEFEKIDEMINEGTALDNVFKERLKQ